MIAKLNKKLAAAWHAIDGVDVVVVANFTESQNDECRQDCRLARG